MAAFGNSCPGSASYEIRKQDSAWWTFGILMAMVANDGLYYGTNGSGAQDLIVPSSGMPQPRTASTSKEHTDRRDNTRSAQNISMNGRAVVELTLR